MVTIQAPIRTGRQAWLLKFSSDLGGTPTFYIYIDGSLVAETKHTEYEVSVNINESYVVEILDVAEQQPMQVFPGKQRLNWFGFTEAVDYYRIDEYVDEAWVERKRKKENGGYLNFTSRFLEDGETHTFRVVPVGTNGNEGTAKEFAVLMVRHPDVPNVGYAYDGGTNKVTISES